MLRVMPIFPRSETLLRPMKQEIHFVTGKGGVGKSVVAAAFALKKSQEGQKVLLVELGNQSFFKDFFALSDVGFKPTHLRRNLDVALWSGEACLQEYARHLIKVESLAKLFFENSVMRAFINIAPALPELAIMGKVTSGPRKHGPPLPYDCVVVDAFATGHFMALMEAPKGMAQAVPMGPMGEQSRSIDAVLRNQAISHYHVVSLPEDLPMKESAELIERLKNEFSLKADLFLNKVLQVEIPSADLKDLKTSGTDLALFAEYVDHHLEKQKQAQESIRSEVQSIKKIPQFYEADPWTLIEKIARAL